MGNTFCMTSPDTAAATGVPVKLATYVGVPFGSLVAYERAALDLPHNADALQQRGRQLLASAERGCTDSNAASTAPLLSLAFPLRNNAERDMLEANCVCADYQDGVPVWVQEVALWWDAAAAVANKSNPSGSVNGGGSVPVEAALRAEQQSAWASGTAQQLRDFVASQRFAKALQSARSARQRVPPRAEKEGGKTSSANALSPSSLVVPQLPTTPLVFAELFRSYEALSRTIRDKSKARGTPTLSPADSTITAAMWCILLCRFLRSLPTPLMPALCSRRLEPLLASHGPHHVEAVLRVLRESFLDISAVDYTAFGFVLHLVHRHRAQLSGDEVEAVASALVWESAVPHVVRAVAHACKPEVHMFRPVKNAVSGGASLATSRRKAESVEAAAAAVAAPAAPPTSTGAEKVKDTGKGTRGVGGAGAAAHRGMEPPSEDDEEEDESSSSESTLESNADGGVIPALDSKEHSQHGKQSTPHTSFPPQPQPQRTKAVKQTVPTTAGVRVMLWHDTSSSSSSLFSSDEDADSVRNKTPTSGSSRAGAVSVGGDPQFSSPAPAAPTKVVAPTTTTSAPPDAPPQPQVTTTAQGVPARVEAPSLVDFSPVRRADPSLLSHRTNNSAVVVAPRADSNDEGGDAEESDSLASALMRPSSPTPLLASPGRSALFPSALEDATVNEAATAAEALRRALLPFGRVSSTSAAGTSTSPSLPRSPSPEGAVSPPRRVAELNPIGCGSGSGGGAAGVPPLPSVSAQGVSLTPRGELQLQQAQRIDPEQQQPELDGKKKEKSAAEEQQQRETLNVDAPAPIKTQAPLLQTISSSATSNAAPPPFRAHRAQPLQAALVEAKLRFMSAPVQPLPWSATPTEKAAPSTANAVRSRDAEPNRDAATRLEHIVACGAEQGWSATDLLAALQRASSAVSPSSAQPQAPQSSTTPTTVAAATPATRTTYSAATHHAAGPAGALPDLLPLNSFASSSEPQRVAVHTHQLHDPQTNRRTTAAATVGEEGGPLTDPHVFTSSSLRHLETTREFRKASTHTVAPTDSGSGDGKTGMPSRRSTTAPAVSWHGVDEDEGHSSGEDKKSGVYVQQQLLQNLSAPQSPLSGSSLNTPVDPTTAAEASRLGLRGNSGGAAGSSASLTAVEGELRRLRDLVQSLETTQFVQAREAAAQTSALAARCAELQREQHEQAQQARLARARLTSVGHEMEDLRDDKARLQMQLTTARQEGAQLRDALLAGQLRA